MGWDTKNAGEALERLRQRASCRSYDEREIPGDILSDILTAGLAAASGGNLQPLSIIVVKDAERKKRLCELNENQAFIAQAPVNLVFVLDWYKLGVFAEHRKAPFASHKSFMHYVIGLEDVMCAAQTIESAAFLHGIGSCYVGTTNHFGGGISEFLNLPERCFPVLLLSLGYPKGELKLRKKLDYSSMVFDEAYPDKEAIKPQLIASYEAKYNGQRFELPMNNAERRAEMLKALGSALLTAYSTEEATQIVKECDERGYLNEMQRIFGLHYTADEMITLGKDIMGMMKKQGLTPFER